MNFRVCVATFPLMRPLKDDENTVEKKYFAESTCHSQTFDNVPVHEPQPNTLVPLKN